jgi:hypothetical protein
MLSIKTRSTLRAIALVSVALLPACRSLTAPESTRSAMSGTRELIGQHVPNAGRAAEMTAIVDQLEAKLRAYEILRKNDETTIAGASANPDATRAELELLYEAANQTCREMAVTIATAHTELAERATPEEWKKISKLKHRIGGQ